MIALLTSMAPAILQFIGWGIAALAAVLYVQRGAAKAQKLSDAEADLAASQTRKGVDDAVSKMGNPGTDLSGWMRDQ